MLGECIPDPHAPGCRCENCREGMMLDGLRTARSRLNAYRGLSSPAYMTLSNKDPILTAFLLNRKLKQLAIKEKYFKVNINDNL